MFDRTRNSLSLTQEFLERDIYVIEWDDMFMHNTFCRKFHYHEDRSLSTRVGNFSVRGSPEVKHKSNERAELCLRLFEGIFLKESQGFIVENYDIEKGFYGRKAGTICGE